MNREESQRIWDYLAVNVIPSCLNLPTLRHSLVRI